MHGGLLVSARNTVPSNTAVARRPQLISDHDIFLFREGTHYRLHDKLGAHFVDLSRIDRADAVTGAMAAQLGFPSFGALLESPTEHPALVVVALAPRTLLDVVMERRFG